MIYGSIYNNKCLKDVTNQRVGPKLVGEHHTLAVGIEFIVVCIQYGLLLASVENVTPPGGESKRERYT